MGLQTRRLTVAMAIPAWLLVSAPPASAQTPAAKAPARPARVYTPPRTPWGDPDVSGVYTNNDESLIPFERPAQFEGRRLEDISPGELEALRDQRSDNREDADRNRAEFRSPILADGPTHVLMVV